MARLTDQTVKFNLSRRIAKLVAPDFRIFSSEAVERGKSVLDLHKKTIEVGEGTTEFDAVGSILFHLGHLRLRDNDSLSVHFGKIKKNESEKNVLKKLSKQGYAADLLAAEWALAVFMDNFNVSEDRARAIIGSLIWSESEWEDYYNETIDIV